MASAQPELGSGKTPLAANLHSLVDQIVADYEAKLHILRIENDKLQKQIKPVNEVRLPNAIADVPTPTPPQYPPTNMPMNRVTKFQKNSTKMSLWTVAKTSTDDSDLRPLNKKIEKDLKRLREVDDPDEKSRRHAIKLEEDLAKYDDDTENFTTIQAYVHGIITWWPFDAIVGVIVIINAITIGIETNVKVQGYDTPSWIQILEYVFLCFYIIELLVRSYGMGTRAAWKSNWIRFDCVLVLCGLIDIFFKIIAPERSTSFLEEIILARFFRLMRLVRATRLMYQFRTLWLLVQGLYCSVLTMGWTFLTMTIVIYVFAVMGMELIREAPELGPEYAIAQSNFRNLSDAMMTLIQMMTYDDMADIYRPLINNRPELGVFFFSFIMLGPITLMNLVTAIIVESSLRQVTDDNEARKTWKSMKRKQIEPVLKHLFAGLDVDCSGSLELEEIINAPDKIQDQLKRVCKRDDLEETFKMLDYDDSGKVNIHEFVQGVLRVTDQKPAELIRIVKQCSDILAYNRAILARMEAYHCKELSHKAFSQKSGGTTKERVTTKTARSMGDVSIKETPEERMSLTSGLSSVTDLK